MTGAGRTFHHQRLWLVWGLLCMLLLPMWARAQLTTVELKISMTAPATANNGDVITYKLEMSNSGPADGNGATFSDTLPPGLVIQSAVCDASSLLNGAQCPAAGVKISGQTVSGVLDTLPNGGAVNVLIQAKLPIRGGGSYMNHATITAPPGRTDTNSATNLTDQSTTVTYRPIDLQAAVLQQPSAFSLGDTLTYVVEYTNAGPGNAGGGEQPRARLGTNQVNAGSTGLRLANITVSCVASGGAICPAVPAPGATKDAVQNGQLYVYSGSRSPDWPSGGKLTYTVTAVAQEYLGPACAPLPRKLNLLMTADVQVDSGLTDSNPSNNTAPQQVANGTADARQPCPNTNIGVTKTQTTSTWSFDTLKEYTLVYTNHGPGPADGSTIRDVARSRNLTGGVTLLNFDTTEIVSCTASVGTECPTFTTAKGGALGQYADVQLFTGVVPSWPVGGTLTVVYRMIPRSYTRPVCGPNGGVSKADIANWGWTDIVTGLTDPDLSNNSTPAVVATGVNVPWSVCPTADLEAKAEPKDLIWQFGQPYTMVYTHENHGPNAADGSTIVGSRGLVTPGHGINSIDVSGATLNCVASGGAVCPTLSTSANATIAYASNFYAAVVDTWPAGGKLTLTYTFTPVKYNVTTCTGNARVRLQAVASSNVVAGMTDPGPAVNSSNAQSLPGPLCADLAVNKTVTPPDAVAPNGDISFSVKVSMPAAAGTLANAVVEDAMPAGVVFDPVVPGSVACNVTAGTPICPVQTGWDPATRKFSATIPSLSGGDTVEFVLKGKAVGYSSAWRNTATIIQPQDGWEPTPGTNSATIPFAIQGTDPKVTKRSIQKSIQAGENVQYEITFTNPANGTPIDNVMITDALMNGFAYVSTDTIVKAGGATGPNASSGPAGTAPLGWGPFSLPAGGVVVITFTTKSPSILACGNMPYNNSALGKYRVISTAVTDERSFDGTLLGNDTDDVFVPCAPVLTKKLSPANISNRGTAQLTFTLTPAPNSAPNALPVSFIDNLPAGIEVLNTSIPAANNTCGATVTKADGTALAAGATGVKISNAVLPSGGSQACSITVNVTNRLGQFNADCAANPTAFTNGAGNMSGFINATNGVTNACLVVNQAPVTLTKGFAPSPILEGETSTATLTFSQPAGQGATTVSLTDTLPAGLRLAPSIAIGGSCAGNNPGPYVTAANGVITISGLPIAANATAAAVPCTVTFGVTHAPGTGNPSCSGNPADFTNGPANVTGRSPNLSAPNNACLVVASTPKLEKRLVGNTIVSGQSTQLIFTITNGMGLPAQTGINFTDNFPSNWRIANSTVSNTCGGTLTNNAASGVPLAAEHTGVKLIGGSMAADQVSCQIVVNVKNNGATTNASCSPAPGAWTNQASNVTALLSLLNRVTPQCLMVIDKEMAISKAFLLNGTPVNTLEPGAAMVTTVLTLANASAVAMTGFDVVDVLPAMNDVAADGSPRDSTRAAGIAGAITGLPPGVAVQYSTVANPCRSTPTEGPNLGGAQPNLPAGCAAPNWQDSVANYATVRALRFVGTGQSIAAKTGTLALSFPMQIGTASTAGDHYGNDVTATYSVVSNGSSASVIASNLATLDVQSAGLTGLVYNDLNANNTHDAGEAGLAGFLVVAKCEAGPTCVPGTEFSILTAADGKFTFAAGATGVHANGDASGSAIPSFAGLSGGTWSLTETPPATPQYLNTGSRAGSAGGTAAARKISNITLSMGVLGANYWFGELQPVAPELSKAFLPTTVNAGGSSQMTWTLTNRNINLPVTLTADLVDSLPAGMTATGASTTCSTATGTGVAEAATGEVRLKAGAIIPAATAGGPGTCTVTATMVATATATNTIATNALQTVAGSNAAPASAILTVLAPARLTVTKTVTPATVAVTGSFPFTVSCQTPAQTYPGSVTISAGNTGTAQVDIPAGSSACQLSETLASRPAAPVNYQWQDPVYVQPAQTVAAPGAALTASITNPLVSTMLTLTKGFAPAAINEGGTSVVTMTLAQPAGAPAATVDFTDTLPAGIVMATGATVGGNCTTTSHASITGNVLKVTGLPLAANGTTSAKNCTIIFEVTHAANRSNASCSASPADFTNGAANVTGMSSNLSYNSAPCLTVAATPKLDKKLAAQVIEDGKTTQLTFTISNVLDKPAQAGIGFTDTLPTSWRVADAVVTNSCGGTLTDQNGAPLATGQTGVRLAGGELAANAASCQIVVNVTNASGQINDSCSPQAPAWTNAAGNISGEANLKAEIATPQCLLVQSKGLGVAKRFERAGTPVTQLESGGVAVDTVIVISNSGNLAVTDVDLVDVLPALNDGRGSTRSGAITAALAGLPAGVTVQYSTQANPCRSTASAGSNPGGTVADLPPGCTAPAWADTAADYSTVRALRFVGTGLSLAPTTGALELRFPMQVDAAAIAGDRLSNDVAANYSVEQGGAMASVVSSNVASLSIATASLAGEVFGDSNFNGIKDAGETGLAGFVVSATCEAGPTCTAGTVYSTLTAADGSFSFAAGATNIFAGSTASKGAAKSAIASFAGLSAGTWSLTETPPASPLYQPTGSVVGTVDGTPVGTAATRKIGSIVLPLGGQGVNYQFGETLANAPSLTKQFAPLTVNAGGTATMTWLLSNPNVGHAATLVAPLIDPMPAGVQAVGNATTTCAGGVVTVTASEVRLAAGAVIPAASAAAPGSCKVTVDVSATATATNTIASNSLQTDKGNYAGEASAMLTVQQPGMLTVGMQVDGGPAGYVPGAMSVYATCDKPTAGTRYPATGLVSVATAGAGSIAGIPVSASCVVVLDASSTPPAPANYRWSSIEVVQPGGAMPAGGSLQASIVAKLVQIDAPTATPTPVPVWDARTLLVMQIVLLMAFAALRLRSRRR